MRRSLLIVLLLGAAALAQPVPTANTTETSQPQASPSETQNSAVAESTVISPILSYRRSVPTYTPKYDTEYGTPYPAATCHGHAAGYYGNPHHECKMFHICQEDGRLETFDCPPYTKFNNFLLVCDWPFKVDYNCDPVHKDDYPAQSYNTAYPVDKSYLPSFLNMYPASKPLYTPAPYMPEKAPVYPVPVVPIYNAHAKTHKSPYHAHEKAYLPAPVYESHDEKQYAPVHMHHQHKPEYVREISHKSYPETPAYRMPSYEKPAQYAVEKAPVHVVYPVVKSEYPIENVAYDTSKLDYVPEKPVYRSHHHVEKVYKEAPPSKDEYSSYAPEKTVVIPLYPEPKYESDYKPTQYQAPVYNGEYREEQYVAPMHPAPKYAEQVYPKPAPVYKEKTYAVPSYDKAYPEKSYMAEKPHAVPVYPMMPTYEKVYEHKMHEHHKHTDKYETPAVYPVHHEHKATVYGPEKMYEVKAPMYAPEYPVEKYVKSYEQKAPAYGPEYPVEKYAPAYPASAEQPAGKMFDYKTFEKYGKYPTTVASYASALKNYGEYVDQHEYAPSPYANYRSRLASILKSY